MSKPHRAENPRLDTSRRAEAGYAYLVALGIIVAMIVGSQVVMENLVTQRRREVEQRTIWCGNQWARAIRLYYRKTGHYPTSIDDLESGVPDMHFLRESAIKNPMSPDGSWRFIYVNSTGQIIGSVRFATLQQMALLDLNNGQMPTNPVAGLPGAVSASSLSSIFSNNGGAGSNTGTPSSGGNSSNTAAGSATTSGAGPGGTSGQNGAANSSPTSASSQAPSGSNESDTPQSSDSDETPTFGQGQPASTFGSSSSTGALGPNANPLAQLTQLQPTGPVDGPVPGAFLTGVGIPTAIDRNSIKVYHGAKKYKDWEFIWNPLEDQAQALQQGLSVPQGQGAQPGPNSGSSPFGTGGTSPLGPTGSASPQPSAPQPEQQ